MYRRQLLMASLAPGIAGTASSAAARKPHEQHNQREHYDLPATDPPYLRVESWCKDRLQNPFRDATPDRLLPDLTPMMLSLTLLAGRLAICRLAPDAPLPAWALPGPLVSLTRHGGGAVGGL